MTWVSMALLATAYWLRSDGESPKSHNPQVQVFQFQSLCNAPNTSLSLAPGGVPAPGMTMLRGEHGSIQTPKMAGGHGPKKCPSPQECRHWSSPSMSGLLPWVRPPRDSFMHSVNGHGVPTLSARPDASSWGNRSEPHKVLPSPRSHFK